LFSAFKEINTFQQTNNFNNGYRDIIVKQQRYQQQHLIVTANTITMCDVSLAVMSYLKLQNHNKNKDNYTCTEHQ